MSTLTGLVRTSIMDAGPRGKGSFAEAAIRKGTRVASFYGKPRLIWNIPKDDWPYAIQVDYDTYVVPKRNGLVWYINHSCDPDCYISGKSLYTWRDIKKGEELTFDYSTDVDWPGFRMKCSCGSPRCRKTIRAYRFLPRELKKRYGRRVAPFILRGYLREERAQQSGPEEPAGRRAALRVH